MGGRFQDRRAFVAGAGQGIGQAVALAREGARVIVASRTLAKLEIVDGGQTL